MTFSAIILAAAKSVGVPGSLLLAICSYESGLKNVQVLQDHGSASYGICQVKEGTAKLVGLEVSGDGLLIPKINAEAAARYLKLQLDRYDGDWCKSVAAYNSGTYVESKVIVGKPRNFKYVKGVTLLLDDEHKDFLICGPRKVEVDERIGN